MLKQLFLIALCGACCSDLSPSFVVIDDFGECLFWFNESPNKGNPCEYAPENATPIDMNEYKDLMDYESTSDGT